MRALLAAVLIAGPVAAESLPALHDVSGVAAGDRLNIRAAPSAEGAILGGLNPAARGIEVTALSQDGRWGQVNHEESAGWVAMRYMQRQPRSDWTEMQTRMICMGTEPFWSLPVDAAGARASLNRMGDTAAPLRIDWSVPVSGRAGSIGWGLAGGGLTGFAALTAEACSDGMSDRMYGISIRLFLTGAAGPLGLGGCCSLVP